MGGCVGARGWWFRLELPGGCLPLLCRSIPAVDASSAIALPTGCCFCLAVHSAVQCNSVAAARSTFFLQELNETKSRLERAQAAAEDFQRRFLQVRLLADIHSGLERCRELGWWPVG